MPSVKRIRVDDPPAGGLGRGRFYFTDDYSVFDWGQMPDRIPGKGASLCVTGAHTFECLEREGVPTHYRGVLDCGDAVGPDDVDEPAREMAIDLVEIPDLPHVGGEYDYGTYHGDAEDCYLVPLEVVFRNTVPMGSSLRRRTTPDDHGLPHAEWPEEVIGLDEPIIEFSTKFERSDRYLDRGEAAEIAGAADLDAIEDVARAVNGVVTREAEDAGFAHQDGKIEVLYVDEAAVGSERTGSADGEIRVADVAGTFDENRFSYNGQQVSKEVVRQYYRREHPGWIEDLKAAKRAARDGGADDWTALCDSDPAPLPGGVVEAVSDLYRAGANAYTDRALFDAPDIGDAVAAVREL